MLRCLVKDNLRTWEECLPYIEFAYNRAKHSSTSFSPFEIVYGANPSSPLDLLPLTNLSFVASDDGIAWTERMMDVHAKVKGNLEKRSA